MTKIKTGLAFILGVSFAGAALAHGGATGIVKERMDGMVSISKAVKQIALMMRGKTAYDAEIIAENARIIQSHAGENLLVQFPQGSNHAPSEAKNEIWQNWEEFSQIAYDLERYAKALEQAAPNGLGKGEAGEMANELDALAGKPANVSFKLLASTCSSCHTTFREKL